MKTLKNLLGSFALLALIAMAFSANAQSVSSNSTLAQPNNLTASTVAMSPVAKIARTSTGAIVEKWPGCEAIVSPQDQIDRCNLMRTEDEIARKSGADGD